MQLAKIFTRRDDWFVAINVTMCETNISKSLKSSLEILLRALCNRAIKIDRENTLRKTYFHHRCAWMLHAADNMSCKRTSHISACAYAWQAIIHSSYWLILLDPVDSIRQTLFGTCETSAEDIGWRAQFSVSLHIPFHFVGIYVLTRLQKMKVKQQQQKTRCQPADNKCHNWILIYLRMH